MDSWYDKVFLRRWKTTFQMSLILLKLQRLSGSFHPFSQQAIVEIQCCFFPTQFLCGCRPPQQPGALLEAWESPPCCGLVKSGPEGGCKLNWGGGGWGKVLFNKQKQLSGSGDWLCWKEMKGNSSFLNSSLTHDNKTALLQKDNYLFRNQMPCGRRPPFSLEKWAEIKQMLPFLVYCWHKFPDYKQNWPVFPLFRSLFSYGNPACPAEPRAFPLGPSPTRGVTA